MLFNSFHYIVFLIVVLLVTETLRRRAFQHTFLLVASYYFYWAFSSFYVVLVVISTLIDFFCGRAIFRAATPGRKKLFLFLSLSGQLGLLAYFKYTNFGIDCARAFLQSLGFQPALHHLNIYLPVGISFYTFITLSYTLDIYYGRFEPIDSLGRFALFVTFFPHLVAGPILRASEFLPQLRRNITFSWENFRVGFSLILYGLIKKIVVADNLAPLVKQTLQGDLTRDMLAINVAIVAFAVQIYCDFSGYTDIAIGSARLLGLTFPENFNYPYFSRNISEFWRRWHMSLASWLRDYLYIPLGGNRHGKWRQCLNLMITMVLGGLWHGAAWNFLLWGCYQGLLLGAHKFLLADRRWMSSRMWNPVKTLAAFWLTCVGWLIFITSDVHRLWFYVEKMLFWDFRPSPIGVFAANHAYVIFLIAVFFLVHTISYRLGKLGWEFASWRGPAWITAFASGLLMIYFFAAGQQQSFIYFQF